MVQDCRMYEKQFPDVDSVVMVQVLSIAEMGAYVQLLEYNNIEGMVLLSELSRRRIRSVTKIIKVGRREPVMVLRVDKEKGYIDLSKRRVSAEDIASCEERFSKSKLVHSIMRHTADTLSLDLETLYKDIGWPLYKIYGHAFEAFTHMVYDPEPVYERLLGHVDNGCPSLTEEVKDVLVKNIRRRMTPQPLKVRADVEMKCYQYGGVEHIKEAMRAVEKAGDENCPVKMKLVAPPFYVLTTQTLDKPLGLEILKNACEICRESIEKNKGIFSIVTEARVVSERDDRLFSVKLQKLEEENQEVSGDSDSEEEYVEGMGSIDMMDKSVDELNE